MLCLWLSFALLIDQPPVEMVDFDTQVMPILTKAGCNAGSCHGAAAGRGGFRLSLYGSRPDADFDEITLALEGRRIDRRRSELSLLLLKPTEQLSHEGGTRLELDGPDFQTVQRWITDGARRIKSRQLKDFNFESEVIDRGDQNDGPRQFQLSTMAQFSDGSTADVFSWTVLTPNDPGTVMIDEHGVATLNRPGRHLIMARFLDQVRPLELNVPWSEVSAVSATPKAVLNSIDDFIESRIVELGLSAAPAVDDFGFIRRLTLDLVGRLPSPSDVTQFVMDPNEEKRTRLVDQLLQTEEFSEFWTHRLAMLFRVPQAKNDAVAARVYYDWLCDGIVRDVPLNEMARQLLLAEGSTKESGPASFFNIAGDARGQAEFVSQAFLGVRLQCANCHDHPLDAWTQEDYHGLAAIFARIRRGAVISENKFGKVIHPGSSEPAIAKIPGGPLLSPESDYRKELAAWMTAEVNPYFGRALVNRVWSHLLGRGLVEPVDDLRVTNPATHPELLDWLTQDFTSHEFRLRSLIRRICNSNAYSRGVTTGSGSAATTEFYINALPKPLSPEVFLDAVADVAGVSSTDSQDVRAISFAGLVSTSEPLDLLGRCMEACESSTVERTNLAVQLQLLNGAVLNDRLAAEDGNLMKAVKSCQSAESLIETFYLRALCRTPRKAELTFWKSQFPEDVRSQRFATVAQDFAWSLLNSDEFSTNH